MTPISCGDMSSEMYLDIRGTFRGSYSLVKFTTGFVYMGPRPGAGPPRTQTSQSVTGGAQIQLQLLQIETKGLPARPMSRSVTVTRQNCSQMLQIKTNRSLPDFNLNLQHLDPKSAPNCYRTRQTKTIPTVHLNL